MGCVLALGVAEAFLRIRNPLTPRLRGETILLPRYARYIVDRPGDERLPARVVHTKNSLGFRGPEPSPDFAARETVVTLGGSTTECFYLSDGTCWTMRMAHRLAEKRPDIWVNNAGFDGHSTFGHLRLIREYIARLRPRWAIFLIGLNDIGRDDLTTWDHSLDPPATDLAARVKRMLRRSEVVLLAQNLRRYLSATRLVVHRTRFDLKDVPSGEVSAETIARVLAAHAPYRDAYRSRLLRLLDACAEALIRPVLLTQPALYGEGIDPATGIDLGRLGEGESHWSLQWKILESYNEVTRAVGIERGVPVIDLARLLPKDSRFFYDTHHFSIAGAEAVGEIVAREFLPILAEEDSTSPECTQPGE